MDMISSPHRLFALDTHRSLGFESQALGRLGSRYSSGHTCFSHLLFFFLLAYTSCQDEFTLLLLLTMVGQMTSLGMRIHGGTPTLIISSTMTASNGFLKKDQLKRIHRICFTSFSRPAFYSTFCSRMQKIKWPILPLEIMIPSPPFRLLSPSRLNQGRKSHGNARSSQPISQRRR